MHMLAAAALAAVLALVSLAPADAASTVDGEPTHIEARALEGAPTTGEALVLPVPGMGPVEAVDAEKFSALDAARTTIVVLASVVAGIAVGVRLIQRGL